MLKFNKFLIGCGLLMAFTTLTSCEKEIADIQDPSISKGDAGIIKVTNIKGDPYRFDIATSVVAVPIVDNVELEAFKSTTVEVLGGREYKINYTQMSGYLVYPTKGTVKVYVDKKGKSKVDIPD